MAIKANWRELTATGLGAVATVVYYDQVAAQAGRARAMQDAIVGTALGGLFSVLTKEAGLLNEFADGTWAGGLVWIVTH
jgi:hypothetical protein